MDQTYLPQRAFARNRSLLLVVALHAVLAWALISGTARREFDKLKASVPMEGVLLQKVAITPPPPAPPPPPPPPPPTPPTPPTPPAPPSLPLLPRQLPPLPKKVALPEPKPVQPEPQRIMAPDLPDATIPESPVSAVVPAPAPHLTPRSSEPTGVITPALAPAPAAPTSAARPGVATAEKGANQAVTAAAKPSASSDIGLVCPTQVVPEVPRRAIKEGIQGLVKAQARVVDGVVTQVEIVSGPRVFHAAVRSAMLQYKCVPVPGEVVATQEFNFRN